MYSEATRNALLETATEQFADRGFAQTSLEGVATAAQLTRGAVYHHFANKQALFEAVLDELERRANERILAVAARTTDPWEAGMAAVEAYLDECCDPTYGRLTWQEGPVALGWTRFKEFERKYNYGMTEQLLQVTMDAGYLERVPLQIPTHLVFWTIGGAGQAIAEAPDSDKQRVRDECAALLRRMFNGMRID